MSESGPGAVFERFSTGLLTILLGAGGLWALGSVVVASTLQGWADAGFSATTLHVAFVVLVGAGWLALLVRFGPLAASAESMQWGLVPPPGSRAGARFTLGASAGATVVGVVVALTLVVAPSLPDDGSLAQASSSWRGLVGPAAATVGAVLLLAAWAVVWQLADAREHVVGLAAAAGVAAVAAAALDRGDTLVAGALTVAAVVALALPWTRGRPHRPRLQAPSWLLVRASQERWALVAGVTLLDGSVTRQVRERWRGSAATWPRTVLLRASPAAPPGIGQGAATGTRRRAAAVVTLLLVRQWRRVAVAVVLGGYVARLVASAGATDLAVSVALLTAGGLAVATSGPADRWAQAPALARTYPALPTWQLLAPSVVGLLLVAATGVVVVGPSPFQAVVVLASAPLVVLSRHRSHDVQTGALASTPVGPLDVGQVVRLVAGWDVVALAILLVAVA